MKLSLRSRFLGPTVALVFLGMFISGCISFYESRKILKNAIMEQISHMADSTVREIGLSIESIELNFTYWSEDATLSTVVQDIIGETIVDQANFLMLKIKSDYGYYENVMAADMNGKIVAGTNDKRMGKNVGDQDFFRQSLKGGIFISDIFLNRETNKPVFSISTPLRMNDEIVGVFYAFVSMTYFSEQFIDPVKFKKLGYSFMYQEDGRISKIRRRPQEARGK